VVAHARTESGAERRVVVVPPRSVVVVVVVDICVQRVSHDTLLSLVDTLTIYRWRIADKNFWATDRRRRLGPPRASLVIGGHGGDDARGLGRLENGPAAESAGMHR